MAERPFDHLPKELQRNAKRTAAKGKRVLLPVSTATGGPMPGIDITDFSALQEMDDLEYTERMKHLK
jgi:hypothetical protein